MKHFKHRLKIKFIKFKNVFLLHHSKKRILYFHAICSLVKTIEMGHKENNIEILLTFICSDTLIEESHRIGDFVKWGNFKIWVPRYNFVKWTLLVIYSNCHL